MNKNFILEIGTEELPPRHIDKGIDNLKKIAEHILKENRLLYENINVYATPRRFILTVKNLDEKQKDSTIEITGPPKKIAFDENGNPTKIAIAFTKSKNVPLNKLQIKPTKKGDYVFIKKTEKGGNTNKLLGEISTIIIKSLEFPKSMRWNSDLRFSRPIRWIFSMYGKEKIIFEINGIHSGNSTFGHRFLSKRIKITRTKDYLTTLRKNFVMVDKNKRMEIIKRKSELLSKKVNGTPLISESLLSENANLTEYPDVILCKFDKNFLKLPKEILTTVMEKHQRYIPIISKAKNILPYFIVVTNGGGKTKIIREGNEKVIKARFKDAEFFYKKDLEKPLEKYVYKLKEVKWIGEIGSLYEKVERVKKICKFIANEIKLDKKSLENIIRASLLYKADQTTEMVKEFTELEGVIGSIYAYKSGETKDIVKGIAEAYLPKPYNNELPKTIIGKTLNIADKIDNITGCFAVGLNPTGSEDPYGVKKETTVILQILFDFNHKISLNKLIDTTLNLFDNRFNTHILKHTIFSFFRQRLENILIENNISYDITRAVLSSTTSMNFAKDNLSKAKILMKLKKTKDFQKHIVTFSRIINIIPNELKKELHQQNIDIKLFEKQQEHNLYNSHRDTILSFENFINNGLFESAFYELIKLCPYINAFFDNVMVMSENKLLKENRLSLLKNIYLSFLKYADFSKIVFQ